MKLDLFKQQWLEMVFDGKNKSYGAYDLRKKSPKMTAMALLVGTAFFAIAIAAPQILGNLLDGLGEDEVADVRKVKMERLPPKEKKPEIIEKPKPPPPKVDQVKFVKPVVAKAEEVTEEIKQITPDVKKTGAEDLKGDPDAPITIEKPSDGPVEEDPETLYNSAGVEVSPEFPGGINKWYSFLKNNVRQIEDEDFKGGQVIVQFVVERDGSLTDIKVLRDVGFGTKDDAIKLFNRSPRWTPAEQNGKKVRCTYVQKITYQAAE